MRQRTRDVLFQVAFGAGLLVVVVVLSWLFRGSAERYGLPEWVPWLVVLALIAGAWIWASLKRRSTKR